MKFPLSSNDANSARGALDVRLRLGESAEVQTFANKNARPLLRLEAIDAMNLDENGLMKALYARLHSGLPKEAIVVLEVNNILPQVWEQLDHAGIAELRKLGRRCEIRPSFQRAASSQSSEAMSEAALDRQWEHFLEQREQNTDELSWYNTEGMKRIEEARQMLQAAYVQEGA